MLDNQTRRELLSKARQSGFPGSILDVFTAYEQGKDLIGEFQQQQQQQQGQQMSDMAAQQSGMMAPGQQPLPQEMPQAPAGPPPGLQGQNLPGPQPPANPNLVDSTQQQPVGMSTNAKGSSGGQVLMATGGFEEKFTEDQYNKFSSHFPFSKEQRGSIAHRATIEHPDLTMVNPKKYVFGGLKYAVGGMKKDPPSYTLPTVEIVAKRNAPAVTWGQDTPDPGFRPPFLRPGPTVENSKIDYLEKGLGPNGKPWQFRQLPSGRIGGDLSAEWDSPIEDAVELVDPTGVSSWNDAALGYKNVKEGKGKFDDYLNMMSAIPVLGGRVATGLRLTNKAVKVLKNIDLANKIAGIGQTFSDYFLPQQSTNTGTNPGTIEMLSNPELRKTHFKFATGGLEGDPLKKGNIATAADSSFVAEGANAPHNFYKSHGYQTDVERRDRDSIKGIFKDLENSRLSFAGQDTAFPSDTNRDVNTGRPITYDEYTTYKPGQHRFQQRETAIGAMNKQAPMSRYDDRILPQGVRGYINSGLIDYADVPIYDKLAVTPWKDLSDAEKLKRLQKYGGSGTPYKDKTSVKQGIEDLKNPMPQLKMKEPGLLPVPKVDLQPQLQNTPNPYTSGPQTEYFIMPSGNPGVGVIHGRTYDGKGGYSEKIIGPSLAKDWFNDEDQKRFDNNDMSGRIDYDPRDNDPDHKVYENMYSATQEVEKLREDLKQQQKQKLRLQMRRNNEANQGAVKFATGGINKKELELDIKPCPPGHIYDPSLGRCVSNDIYTVGNLLRDDGIDSQQAIKKNAQYYQGNEFMKAWQQSPMYDKMLKEADPANYEYIRKMRLANLESTPPLKVSPQPKDHPRYGGWSFSNSGQVEIFPAGFGTTGTATHELSHSSDRPVAGTDLRLIPQRDVDYVNKHKGKVFGDSREYHNNKKQYDADFKEYQDYGKAKQDNYKEYYSDYVGDPTEVRARLSVIRQVAADRGLYNPFKQKVTPELYYQKLKNHEYERTKKDYDPMKQLQETFSDEEIIWLLNHMSAAPVKEKEEIFRGKTGGFNQGNYKLLKKRK